MKFPPKVIIIISEQRRPIERLHGEFVGNRVHTLAIFFHLGYTATCTSCPRRWFVRWPARIAWNRVSLPRKRRRNIVLVRISLSEKVHSGQIEVTSLFFHSHTIRTRIYSRLILFVPESEFHVVSQDVLFTTQYWLVLVK